MSRTREIFDSWIAAFNRPDGLDDYIGCYAPDVVVHGFPPGVKTREDLRAMYAGIRAALPDRRLHVDDVIVEGDKLACRYRLAGTHRGELLGVPPTGRDLVLSGQTIVHFRNGVAIERWQALDEAGLMRQLGILA